MTAVAVTVWDRKHDDPTVRAVLDRVRPQIIQLHVDPLALVHDGKRAADHLRAWYPGVEVWFGLPGDSHGPNPSDAWLRAYRVACDSGITMMVLDPESAWKTRPGARDIAKGCMATLANAKRAGTEIGLTSFDTIEAVGYKDAAGKQRYWGGHSVFPWKEFLGPSSPVGAHFPQVYAATANDAPRGATITRNRRSRQSIDNAILKHTLRAPGEGLAWHVYLQSHHTPSDDLVTVASGYKIAAFWASPTRLDEAGLVAMERLARAHEAQLAGKAVGEAIPPPLPISDDVDCGDPAGCHIESAVGSSVP